MSAEELSERTQIPFPLQKKLLGKLAYGGYVLETAEQGIWYYKLLKMPNDVTISDMIDLIQIDYNEAEWSGFEEDSTGTRWRMSHLKHDRERNGHLHFGDRKKPIH